jgi:hypothetical protein
MRLYLIGIKINQQQHHVFKAGHVEASRSRKTLPIFFEGFGKVRVKPHSFGANGMILKCKMRRGQPKSVLAARLRMAPMQDAFKILSYGLAENGLISLSHSPIKPDGFLRSCFVI